MSERLVAMWQTHKISIDVISFDILIVPVTYKINYTSYPVSPSHLDLVCTHQLVVVTLIVPAREF